MSELNEHIVTDADLDTLQDAVSIMKIAAQLLSEDISPSIAAELSWMIGSTRKRLEPVLNTLELVQMHQQSDLPMACRAVTPDDAYADIRDKIIALWDEWIDRRKDKGSRT